MVKTIVTIDNPQELAGFIKGNGTQCRFVSLVSSTEPKLKAGCPFKGVHKVSKKRGVVNMNYVESVKRHVAQLTGSSVDAVVYEAGETWYKHLMTDDNKALPLVVNKTKDDGKQYLQYFPRSSSNVYVMPDGTPVSESELEPWFYKKSPRSLHKPIVMTIELCNIKEIRASGVIMHATDFDEAEQALSLI